MPPDELDDLIVKYFSGVASEDEARCLDAILRGDPAARRFFLELSNLDFAIEKFTADLAETLRDPPTADVVHGRLPWVAASILSLLVVLAACMTLIPTSPVVEQPPTAPAASRVATFVRVVGPAGDLRSQSIFAGKRFEFGADTTHLVTITGVTLVIESPTVFTFESAGVLRLERGRLVADVPPAGKGFTVVTPSGKAIDLGTNFGVAVDPSGATEIHVFKGLVVAENVSGQQTTLRGGEAVTISRKPSPEGFVRCPLRPGAFVREDEIVAIDDGRVGDRMSQSQTALARLRKDSETILLLDFEAAGVAADDCGIVAGRWPGSRAAQFSESLDHITTDVAGDRTWKQVTLAAWVRIDRIGESFQSLYHTDRWNDRAGSVHWMITPEARVRLAVQASMHASETSGYACDHDSSTFLAGKEGRWLHLATVYDTDNKTVRFYVDGVVDRESELVIAPQASLGPAQIGNWKHEDRVLGGRIDEFTIVGRALTDDEIRSLHAAGTPYP